MKKKFFGLFAVATMLLASSCTENEIISQSTGNEVKVTFTTELRNDVKSRAVGDDTDGIDQLQFAVYDESGTYLEDLDQTITKFTNGEGEDAGKKYATIEVVLVKGQTYSFAFWAQDKDYTAYNFTPKTATISVGYNQDANNKNADAFFAKINNFTVTGSFEQNVTLKRPFAQVNFLTTASDLEKAGDAGFEPSQSSIVIENAATSLNLLDGSVSGSTSATFVMSDLVEGTETAKIKNGGKYVGFSYDGKFPLVENLAQAEPFHYLATAYFLPTEATGTVKITASMSVSGNTSKTVDLTAADITAQRNYRTNIYGNLLTSNGKFNVTVDPGFDGDHSEEDEEETTQVIGTIEEANKLFEQGITNVTITEAPKTEETITLPNTNENVTIYFSFGENADSSKKINIKYNDDTEENPANIEINGNAGDLIINAPESTVTLNGNFKNVEVTTAPNTLIVPKGCSITKLTIKQGNVRIANGAEVSEILRSEENKDEITYIIFEGMLPEEANENPLIAYVSAAEFDLIYAAANGGEVKLTSNVELAKPLVVIATATTSIDLNGYTLSYTSEAIGETMITNKGNLTIKDSSNGEGEISYIYEGEADGTYAKGNYTISNNGTLTVDNGSINIVAKECTGKFSHAFYVIQNGNGGSLTVKDGKIYNDYNIAVRQFGESNVTIEGGEIKGLRAIWMQAPGSNASDAPEMSLTVTNGTLTGTAIDGNADNGNKLAIYSYSYGNSMENMKINISGGTFNGDVALTGGSNKTSIETVNITGGTFNGLWGDVYSYGDDALAAQAITIKGGEFSSIDPMIYMNSADEVMKLNKDVELEDATYTFKGNGTLDLNEKKVTSTSTQTGKNYNLIDVNKGNLTIKNGTITTLHTGENMGWNNSTNVFNVTAGGVLNLEGVTAKNLGGSDMAFVAHLNNWGEVTLNVDNSTLESTYIAVRVFNSGSDGNNVTIKNTTLKGSYCLWVHNYIGDLDANKHTNEAIRARLKFDLFDGTNTFIYNEEKPGPVFYGFNNYVYFDKNGNCLIEDEEELAATLSNGGNVKLTTSFEDINVTTTTPYGNSCGVAQNGGVLDGQNNALDFDKGPINDKGQYDNYGIMTSGGTIKNVTITGVFRGIMIMNPTEDVIVENAIIGGDEDMCYAINTGEGDGTYSLTVSNSTIKGWSSYGTAIKNLKFTNCTFGQGKYYTTVYGRLVKPYVDTVFENCEFGSKFYIDLSALTTDGDGNVVNPDAKVTLKNCTINGVKLTKENWKDLIAPENSCGEGQISVELKDGSYLSASNVVDYITFE